MFTGIIGNTCIDQVDGSMPVTNAQARLLTLFDDPLFVRCGGSMMPTLPDDR